MNLPFCVAALLHDRDFFVDQVTEKTIRRPDILATTQKIEVIEDSQFDALGDDGRHGVSLEVQLSNGKTYAETVLHAKGSDRHPMSDEEVLKKFRLLAGRVLSASQVERLLQTLLNLEKLDDARQIAKLLTIRVTKGLTNRRRPRSTRSR
jgi:2-methylcitrate dehydratase PrpD